MLARDDGSTGIAATFTTHSLLKNMDFTFICARCSKTNASTSSLPAGFCSHETCRGLLCGARDMDDGGDPAAGIPVKPSSPTELATPPSTPAPPCPPNDASAESMIAEMHALQKSIEAGVASVNAATSVRTLRCKCLRLPRVASTTRQDASLVAWRRRRQLYPNRRRPGAP